MSLNLFNNFLNLRRVGEGEGSYLCARCILFIIYASYGTLQYQYFQTGNPKRHYAAEFTDKDYMWTVAYDSN